MEQEEKIIFNINDINTSEDFELEYIDDYNEELTLFNRVMEYLKNLFKR